MKNRLVVSDIARGRLVTALRRLVLLVDAKAIVIAIESVVSKYVSAADVVVMEGSGSVVSRVNILVVVSAYLFHSAEGDSETQLWAAGLYSRQSSDNYSAERERDPRYANTRHICYQELPRSSLNECLVI